MASDDIKTLNELIEKLKVGEIDGEIEVIIKNKGKENRIFIKADGKNESAKKNFVKLDEPELSDADFSRTNLRGSNFYGLNLSGANFSYAIITESDLSNTNLKDANFYKARLSQTNLANAYNVSMPGSYLTGSVNLYNATEPGEIKITNAYGGGVPHDDGADEYEQGEHPVDMSKKKVTLEDTLPQHRKDDYWG